MPLRDGVDQTVNLAIKLAEPPFEPQAFAIRVRCEALAFDVIGSHVFGEGFGGGGVRLSFR